MVFKHALFMKGFTLIEVLVTVFILGLLATVLVVQLNNNDPVKNLNRDARAVVNVLQLARSNANSGYNAAAGVHGYGVHADINSANYSLYADQNDNQQYDAAEAITNYALNQNNSFQANYDIFFSLTDATVYNNGNLLSSNEKNIILQYGTGTGITKTIIISGLTAAISYDE